MLGEQKRVLVHHRVCEGVRWKRHVQMMLEAVEHILEYLQMYIMI